MVSLQTIPNNLLVPGTYFEFDPSNANTALPQMRTLIIGQPLSSATGVVYDTPINLGSVAQVRAAYGAGSHLARTYAAYRAVDSFTEVWALPVQDASGGTLGTTVVTLTAASPAAGTLNVYICGTLYEVAVSTTSTATTLAASLVAAVNADPYVSCVATSTTGVVTLSARNKGVNDLNAQLNVNANSGEATPSGVTMTVVQTVGTGDPVITNALANLQSLGTSFDTILCSYTGAFSQLDSYLDETVGSWSYHYKLYGHAISARKDILSGHTTFFAGINYKHVSCLALSDLPQTKEEIAATIAAYVMNSAQADVALPIQNISTYLIPGSSNLAWTFDEMQTLLAMGASVVKVVQGTVVIARMTTTYTVNSSGVADNSYQDIETMYMLPFATRYIDTRLSTKFARKKLAPDGTQIPAGSNTVTPTIVKLEVVSAYRDLCDQGVCVSPDVFAKTIQADAVGGMVRIYAPIQLVQQLRIVAVSEAFSK